MRNRLAVAPLGDAAVRGTRLTPQQLSRQSAPRPGIRQNSSIDRRIGERLRRSATHLSRRALWRGAEYRQHPAPARLRSGHQRRASLEFRRSERPGLSSVLLASLLVRSGAKIAGTPVIGLAGRPSRAVTSGVDLGGVQPGQRAGAPAIRHFAAWAARTDQTDTGGHPDRGSQTPGTFHARRRTCRIRSELPQPLPGTGQHTVCPDAERPGNLPALAGGVLRLLHGRNRRRLRWVAWRPFCRPDVTPKIGSGLRDPNHTTFRSRNAAMSAAEYPSPAKTSSLCAPSSGAIPIFAGVSEKCQGEPCTFSFLPCLGY